jgi:thiosulfate/3-mercaptopyruvate sulfurtransferase
VQGVGIFLFPTEKTKISEIVSVEWLRHHLRDENLVILDASLKSTAGKTIANLPLNSIPKSRYFDIEQHFSDQHSPLPNTLPTPQKFELECRKLGINNGSKIVVFDHLGIYSSPRVWWMFSVMGHHNVSVLDGGLPEWTRKGLPTAERANYIGALGSFKASLSNEFVITYQDVLANTVDEAFSIIDARSAGRFNGTEKEARKHLKSGHIPNSINIPYPEVLKNGKFRTERALKEVFEERCSHAEGLVFSCGSGLTACIVMMASEIGYKKSRRIYDGSWTEWAELQNLKEDAI